MTEINRAIMWFIFGAILALLILVQLDMFGPSLGERISEGICLRTDGAWDSTNKQCVRMY